MGDGGDSGDGDIHLGCCRTLTAVAVVAVTSSYLAPIVVDVDVEHEASRIVELHFEPGRETTPVIRTCLGPDHL